MTNNIHSRTFNPVGTITNTIMSAALFAAMLTSGSAYAYELRPNTIYAQANSAIFAVDVDNYSATKVADAPATMSELQDLAFVDSDMYGVNQHWQVMKLGPLDSQASTVKEAESYSLSFQGLESRDGVLYAAEHNSLVKLDRMTGMTQALCDGCGAYGLGAGELVTDLAFSADGTLYAVIDFSGIPYSYFGHIDTSTGNLNLIGNTYVKNLKAITEKDGVMYAMGTDGSLHTLNKVSGFATQVAQDVLAGVAGMGTSTDNIVIPLQEQVGGNPVDDATESTGGSGSMSWLILALANLILIIRRLR